MFRTVNGIIDFINNSNKNKTPKNKFNTENVKSRFKKMTNPCWRTGSNWTNWGRFNIIKVSILPN